jgi:hypothetical protein
MKLQLMTQIVVNIHLLTSSLLFFSIKSNTISERNKVIVIEVDVIFLLLLRIKLQHFFWDEIGCSLKSSVCLEAYLLCDFGAESVVN